eukprot:3166862-Amphidinium_carterae.1
MGEEKAKGGEDIHKNTRDNEGKALQKSQYTVATPGLARENCTVAACMRVKLSNALRPERNPVWWPNDSR